MKNTVKTWALGLTAAFALTALAGSTATAKPGGSKGGSSRGSINRGRSNAGLSDQRFTPPGWSKGNKTGWGDGTRPPGLRNRVPAGLTKDRDLKNRELRDRNKHDHGTHLHEDDDDD